MGSHRFRGQSSTEFLILFAAAVAIFAILYSVTVGRSDAFSSRNLEFSANLAVTDLANAAREVHAQGTGARKIVTINLPRSYDPDNSRISQNAIILRAKNTDYVRTFSFVLQGSMPESTGTYYWAVENDGTSVIIGDKFARVNRTAISAVVIPGWDYSDSILVSSSSLYEMNGTVSLQWPDTTDVSITYNSSNFSMAPYGSYEIPLQAFMDYAAVGSYYGKLTISLHGQKGDQVFAIPITLTASKDKFNAVRFVPPTPDDGAEASGTIVINASIASTKLTQQRFLWQGNYTYGYDDSLVLAYNFDDVKAIGDTASKVKDISLYGNDGAIYGNTALLLHLDETSGLKAYDESAYKNNGSCYNMGGYSGASRCNWVDGKSGKGVQFDGVNDYIDLGNSSSLNITSAITIEAWAKFDSAAGGSIISRRSLASNEYLLYSTVTAQRIRAIFWGLDSALLEAPTATTLGRWYHVVATYDQNAGSDNYRLYVDGVKVNSTTATGQITSATGTTTRIGYDSYNYFNGTIDEVMIANRSLSASEVLVRYNAGRAHHADWDAEGKWGSALKFDGTNDYVDAGNTSSLDITTDITISAWIKPQGHGTFRRVVEKKSAIRDDGYLIRVASWDTAQFITTNSAKDVSSSTVLNDNTWYYVTGVQSGTSYKKIYINGIEEDSVASPEALVSAAAYPLRIGMKSYSTGENFNGTIDEVRIWNRSLSATEIKQQYYSNIARYSPAIWVFSASERGVSSGSYDYRVLVRDSSGQENSTELRTVIVNNSLISFAPPTPASGYLTSTAASLFYPPTINASIRNVSNLSSMSFGWGGQNYSFYDSSLVLAYNLDYAEALGEGNVTKDVSRYGNDGAVFGNTKLLLRFDENGTSGTAYDESVYKNNGAVYGNTLALLHMDENSGTKAYDETWYRNNATCYNMTGGAGVTNCNWDSGKNGSGISFDGVDDYASVDNVGSISGDLTLYAWVKPSTVQAYNARILDLARAANYGLEPCIQMSNNQLFINDGYGPSSNIYGPVIGDGNWHFITVVRQGTSYSLYSDGVYQNSSSGTVPVYTNLQIGRMYNNAYYFNGSIDEAAVINRSLSAAEVLAQYNAGRAKHIDWVEGKSGTALAFDGVDDYVDLGTGGGVSNAFTFVTWFKAADSAKTQRIANFRPASGDANEIRLRLLGSKLNAVIVDQQGSSTGGYKDYNGATTIANDTWYFLTYSWDGNSLKVYLNGQEDLPYVKTTDNSIVMNDTSRIRNIGRSPGGSDYVNATLDEFAVYSKALNATEVLAHYNVGKAKHADWTAAGKVGGALAFDGVDDYASVPDSPSLDINSSITISAWVKLSAVGSDYSTIVAKRSGNSANYYLRTGLASRALCFGFRDVSENYRDWQSYSNAISLNDWTHILLTYTYGNASSIRAYANGVEVAGAWGGPGTQYAPTNAYSLLIGLYGAQTFNGALDEVRIWNRSLSAAEVAQQYYGSLNKYAADKWLFTSTPQNYTGTYTYFASVTTNESVTESTPTQNLTMVFNRIGFLPPTPDNGISTSNASITINASIYNLTLDAMKFNWNGVNSSFYDSSLVLAYNFDDVSAIGDTAGKVVDVSRQGNNGAVYANTLLLLHMDEGTSSAAYDESVYRNNGTCYNMGGSGVTNCNWVAGKSGNAIQFDGTDDYVGIPSASSLSFRTPFAIMAWFKTTKNTGYGTIFNKDSSGFGYNQNYHLRQNGNVLFTRMGNGTTACDLTGLRQTSDGQWHHGVAMWTGNELQLYVDGTFDKSVACALTPYTNSDPVRIGLWGGASEAFNGSIDEAMVVNRSLSASEILVHYNAGKARHADWDADGKWGSAMKFDGVNDYVALGAPIEPVQSKSMELWFKTNSPHTGLHAGLAGRGAYGGTGTDKGWSIYARNGALLFRLGDAAMNPVIVMVPLDSYYGKWTHAVGVQDSSLNKSYLYLNGVLVGTADAAGFTAYAQNFNIGYTISAFNGSIDEVRIWNRSLSASEIQQYYYGSLNKYAPDKWLFSSTQGNLATGNYTYYGYAHGSSGDSNFSETRSVNILGDMAVFVPPTPENGSSILDSKFQVNASIANLSLSKMRFYLDGTGYDFYNDSLVLAYNFDDVSSIGDSARKVADLSRYGNNGTIYGNTALLLHFDENSGSVAYDESVNRNNGTISGAVRAAGKSGSGLQFDGVDDVVTVPNTASLNFTGPFSMEAWIKPSAVQSNLYPKVIAKQNHYVFHITQSLPSALVLNLFNASGLQQTGSNENALAPGVWNHVVMTYNGSYVSMYVNGTQLTTNNRLIASLSPMTEEAIGIGRYPASTTPFNGSIDEVGLYNRTLSASEILSHYNAGKAKHADWDPNGTWNSAMAFDGVDDYVEIADNSSLRLANGGTISAWIYPKSIGEGGAGRIIHKGSDAQATDGFELQLTTSNRLAGYVAGGQLVSAYGVLTYNQWNFVTLVFNGNGRKLLVNGVDLTATGGSGTALPPDVAGAVAIGNRAGATDRTFNGSIDELHVWNRSLSSAEIMQNYYGSLNKYAPGKWLFQSNLSNVDNGGHTFSVWVQDVSGSVGVANRSVQVSNSISFMPPTPADGTLTSYAAVVAAPPVINATIQGIQLSAMNLSLNGANYPFYNDSLVLAYNFDNIAELGDSATSVADVSRCGNTGSVVGATWNTSGIYGGSMAFDGVNDYVSAGTPSSLNITRDLTISAWINPQASMNWNQIVRKYRSYAFGVIGGDELSLRYYTGGVWSTGVTTSTANLQLNRWYHVAVTRSFSGTTGTSTIYINGAQNVTGSLAGYADSPDEEIVVGSTGGSSEFFSGSMDEVRVWNRSLSAAEVAQQYYGSLNKYASDKWLFTSIQSNLSAGAYSYSASVLDSNGFANSTGPRRLSVSSSRIGFMAPTPSDGTYYDMSQVLPNPVVINTSIVDSAQPQSVVFNWNGTNQSVYDSSLVLAFNFDNVSSIGDSATNAVDVSMYGNNGTLVNGTAWTSQGRYGNALDFDGVNDWVDAGNSTSLNVNNSFAIEMWMKRRALSTDRVGLLRRDSSDTYSLYTNVGTAGVLVRFRDSNNTHHSGSAVNVPTGVWNHLVGAYDGQSLLFYLNGALATNTSIGSFTVGTGTNNLVIGRDDPNPGRFFNGTIDEVRVYNRSLSSAEVSQHYYSNLRKYSQGRWLFESAKPINQSGAFTYYAYLNDSAGSDQTEVRTLNVGNNSWISFLLPTPENGEATSAKPVVLNASVAGINLASFGLNWNGVNYSFLDPSLVLAYNFDNVSSIGETSTKTVDVSKDATNGTIYNFASTTAGRFGTALYFNGNNSHISVPDKSSLKYSGGDLSLEAWINVSPGETGEGYILSKPFNGNGWYNYYVRLLNSRRIYAWVAGWTSDAAVSSTALPFGSSNWYHLAVVYDSDRRISVYLNGILSAQAVHSITNWTANYGGDVNLPLSIGTLYPYGSSWPGNTEYTFNGSIDEVRIWNRSLTAAEIQQHYFSSLNKYAPDKWLFTSNQGVTDGAYNFSAYAVDSQGRMNSTETRSINVGYDWISFVAPTPANGSVSYNSNINIAANVTSVNLSELAFNWNGTNTTYINDSLVLAYNFDDVELIGDSAKQVSDLSRNGNNGLIYSATKALLHFDENSGSTTRDESNNSYTCPLSGPAWTQQGKSGPALDFDGNGDYVSCSGLSVPENGTASFEIWVNFRELATDDSTHKYLFPGLLYQHSANNYFYLSGTSDYFSWVPSKNTWYHLVLTYSNQSNTAKLYHNGVASSTTLQGTFRGISAWYGAISHNSGNYAINGTLDEFAVYTRVLTPAEVAQHYAAGRAHPDGWDPNGAWNSAMKFDGVDDYVSTPSFALSSADSTTTYSFWLKDYPSSASYQNIFTDKSQGASGFIWIYRRSADALRAEYSNGTTYVQPSVSNFFTGYDGVWVKTDVVYDYANRWIKFYRNGAFLYWYNATDLMLFPSANRIKYIGGTSGYGFLNGSIDEVRVWNRALSPAEIQQTYYSNLQKYAPDKWLFNFQKSGVPEGAYSYYAYAKDTSGSFDFSETRTTQVGNIVGFVPPTPEDRTTATIGAIAGGAVINATAYSSNLSSFLFNWDGKNYQYYDNSLVLAYNFDNNSAIGETAAKAVDVSPYGNNGSISGAAYTPDAKYGRALLFDGTDSVNSTASFDIYINNSSITFEAWIKPSRITNYIMGSGASNANHGLYSLWMNSGALQFAFVRPAWATSAYTTSSTVPINTWSHVVVSHQFGNGAATRIYLNGVEQPASWSGGTGNEFSACSSTCRFDVGHWYNTPPTGYAGYYFSGAIDEVRVYNRVLSADEAKQHYYSSFSKYAPDKWLFQFSPEAYVGDHQYYAYAADANGNASYSETRALTVEKHAIGFMPPTPADGAASDNTSLPINASIAGISLSSAKLSVDGMNYSFYDGSLLAAYNFDNIAALNDTSGKAVDFSRYGNNASLYGNTVTLLHMDEGSGGYVYDESARGNNGTITGATWASGKTGFGLSFAGGSNTVQISSAGIDATAGAINTVEFWMYPNNISATGNMAFGWGVTSYDLFAHMGCFGFNTGNSDIIGIPISSIPGGITRRWVHVVAGFHNGAPSPTNNYLYLDGVKQSISYCWGSSSNGRSATQTAVISGWGPDGSYKFNGSIDEFAIYSKVLSASEVLSHYNSGRATHADYTTAGKYSGGLLFDGANDYAQTAQPVALGTGDLTFSAWVKGTPMGADSEQGIISAYYSGKPWFFSLERSTYVGCGYSGCLSMHVGYPDQSPYVLQAGNWPAADEGWHFVAVTRNSSTMALFLDGTEVVSSSQPGFTGFDVGTRYLRIGAPSQGYFNGTIDEVRIYNRSMSVAELRQQYYSSLNKYAPDRWLFSGAQQNLAVGNHSYQLHVFDSASSRSNSTSLRTYNVMPNAYIGFTAPTISSGTYDFTYLAASPAAINLTVYNAALSNLSLYWNSTNYTFYDSSLVAAYNFGSIPALGESSSVAKDFSVYGNHGTLTSNSTNGVVDDFERRNWLGWTEGCGGNTELSLTKGYRSQYALSIKARGGDGYACALKNVTVTNGSSLSYACKGDLCQMCLYNGTTCCNTQMVCDYGLGDGDAGWRVCNVVANYSGNLQLRLYSSFYNGTHYNSTPGALSTYDFLTFGPIPAEGKYGSALQFDGVDDYVSFTPPISSIPTDLTVEAWMYRKSNVSHKLAVVLSDSAGIYGTEAAHILLSNHAGKLAFRAGGNGYELLAGNGLQYLSSSDGWYHVVGMKSGTSYYLYVNGQLAAQTTQSGISGTIARASIGDTLHPAYTYNDKVDEVRIWNRSFTADEIAQHYYSNLQKYAPDKWLFQSSQQIYSPGTSTFYAWAGGNGEASTETRTVVADASSTIGFIPATPVGGSTVYSSVIGINASIANASGLSELKLEADGSNFSFLDSSLVLAYNFDNVASLGENSTRVVDLSAYGNNGTVTGANYTQSGKYGSALNFSANNQYLRFESTAVLNITEAITLEAWVRPAEMQTCRYSFILSKYWRWYLNMSQYTNIPMFRVAYVSSIMGQSGFNPGDWYHLVGTYANDGSQNNFRLYVNGQLEAQKTASGAIPLIAKEGYVGRGDASGLGCGFNGTIDEVRVYNRSLSSAEVSQHYYSNLAKYAPDKWLFQSVQGGLASGSHSFNVYAKDSAGTALPLSARTFNARTILLSAPTPENSIVQYDNNLTINATIADFAPREVKLNWNGESYSFYDDSLVLAYNFDNVAGLGDSSSKAVDVSKYANNGTLMNGTVWTPDGRWGGAMQFNGIGDFISLAHLPELYEPSWTFFAWFKPMNDTAWVYQTIYSSGYGVSGAVDRNEQLLVDVNATWLNVRQYALNDGSGTWHEAHVNITSRAFNNVAVVRTSLTNYDIYLNGEFQKSLQVFNANRQTIIDTIGARYTGIYGSFFNGTIDEVRIWNRSLSAEEIRQQYYGSLNKYAPTKWLFTSTQPGAGAQAISYNLTVLDVNGNLTVGEGRTNTFNKILFHQPSVANNQVVDSQQFNLNTTIHKMGQLNDFKVNFAGQDTSFLNDSLVLAMNFDDVADIGDTAGTVKDISRYGNDGTVYGNTIMLLHMDEADGGVAHDESVYGNDASVFSNTRVALHMDEGSGSTTYDETAYGNNGACYNMGGGSGVTSCNWVFGKYGKGIAFDGVDDSINVPSSTSVNISGSITLEAWVYPLSAPAVTYGGTIVTKGGSYYLEMTNDSHVEAYFYGLSASGYHKSTNVIPTNAWSHVAVTVDGTFIRIYINGALDRTIASNGTIALSGTAFYVGGLNPYAAGYNFNGTIDEVGVYYKALNATEIQEQYLAGKVKHVDWVDGKRGTGLNFDGSNDYVSILPSSSLNFTGAFAIEAWIKNPGVNAYDYIFDSSLNGSGNFDQLTFRLSSTSGDGKLYLRMGQTASFFYVESSNRLDDNQWHHVVGSYDGYNVTLYDNGVLVATNTVVLQQILNAKSRYIGSWQGGSHLFNGTIDEFGLYNRSLSSAEVLSHYAAGKVKHADWDSNGKWGSAMKFDGLDHYVSVPNSDALNITDKITMSAWVNLKPANVGYSGRIILGKGPSNYYQNYGLWTNQGATSFFVQLNTTVDLGMPGYSTDLTNGWHHLAATYDGTVTKFFLDSVLVKTDYGYSGAILPTTNPLIISSASQRAVNGSVDEVRVFNRPLSENEVRQLYYSNLAKYAPDKWVFSSYWNSSEDVNDDHPYYLFANTTAGNASYSQVRTLRLRKNMVSFLPATPADGATSPTANVTINATIQNISLSRMVLNWNGTNTTAYDRNSLILAYNFDDVQSIGDSASRAVDVSGNGNNGTIIGNTMLMLRMDEAGGNFSYDEGRLSNNGTCYNTGGLTGVSACNWTAGKSNSGIIFDGYDDVIRLAGNVTLPGPFTFSTWFNKRSTGTYQTFVGVDAGYSCSGGCPKIIFYAGSDYVMVRATDGGSSPVINVAYNPTTMDNTWNFLAVTRDETGMIRGSLNGAALVTTGTTLNGTMHAIRIGGSSDSGQYFNGSLDELAFYNRSINMTEITALYSQGRARRADWDPNGKWGSALKFDGINDYVELPGSSAYINSNGTVAAWVKFASLPPATAGYMTIASTVNASQNIGWKFELYESSGAYRLAFRKWTPEQSANTIIPTPTLGQWVHLAASWNGTNIMLYRNGVLESRNSIGSPTPGSSVLRIGTDTRALFQQSLNGSIDEFRMWNVSLSGSEIQQQYYSSLNKYAPDKWLFTTVQQSQPSGTHNYTLYIDNGNTVYNSTAMRTTVVS